MSKVRTPTNDRVRCVCVCVQMKFVCAIRKTARESARQRERVRPRFVRMKNHMAAHAFGKCAVTYHRLDMTSCGAHGHGPFVFRFFSLLQIEAHRTTIMLVAWSIFGDILLHTTAIAIQRISLVRLLIGQISKQCACLAAQTTATHISMIKLLSWRCFFSFVLNDMRPFSFVRLSHFHVGEFLFYFVGHFHASFWNWKETKQKKQKQIVAHIWFVID